MAYKVVYKSNDKLYSCLHPLLDKHNLSVEYKKGKFVKGKYPLFVFKELENAVEFIYAISITNLYKMFNIEIWKCKTRGIKVEPKLIVATSAFRFTDLDKFWEHLMSGHGAINKYYLYSNYSDINIPQSGTIVVDEVMLTKRIDSYDSKNK